MTVNVAIMAIGSEIVAMTVSRTSCKKSSSTNAVSTMPAMRFENTSAIESLMTVDLSLAMMIWKSSGSSCRNFSSSFCTFFMISSVFALLDFVSDKPMAVWPFMRAMLRTSS